ncbi:protein FAR1-RELATED SEQUENCE 5-like [Argentina anserina]|uniref:protein FAR1-RELATED SEQUENCE 5-like n=1 Tax=Argentina anserina TaxID=57926 RepID=UPI002176210A|nr:protein FAR1-RELATED SEQUENCE 5-like [Potentilla anserina]
MKNIDPNVIQEQWKYPNNVQLTYVSEVEDDIKPKPGQQFDSLDAAYKFYNDYARKAGFGVRKSKETKKGKHMRHGEITMKLRKETVEILEQAGGHENVGCTERDLRNAVRDERNLVKGHDVDILYEHFKAEQEKNLVDTDAENRLIRCFWVDSSEKKSYAHFGDVVVFDTTYNTNRYKMFFAPLLGVNHHGQTLVFGCTFLSNENFDSFVWLLNTWLAAMPRGAPKVIITDQDQAMAKAIGHVLPNTFHRYCVWHILRKFQDKTSTEFMNKYYDSFKACIWDSESPDEFERRWFEELQKKSINP